MAVDIIYNRYGQPEIRLLSDRFLDFKGNNLGYLFNGSIYSYDGRHLGWYENGILRDHTGDTVGFGQFPKDYPRPLLPLRSLAPMPSIPHIPPMRMLRELPPRKPIKSFNWSIYTPLAIFYHG